MLKLQALFSGEREKRPKNDEGLQFSWHESKLGGHSA
jgi:hypothetical protein